jgi:hypothetical protein
MSKLGAVVCQAIVHHYGRDEFLRPSASARDGDGLASRTVQSLAMMA